MKYKIYELVQPEHLQKIEYDNYYTTTINREVLQEMKYDSKLSEDYNTFDDAMNAIKNNIESLKYKRLTILPIIDIRFDGIF